MPTAPWTMYPQMHQPPPMLRGTLSFALPQGDAGIAKTMDLIRAQVDQAIKDSAINRAAIDILDYAGAPQYDNRAAAMAIYGWIRRNIRYVPDPVGKETVRPARVILSVGAGDCDDINGVLIPSLLGTIGIPTRGVTVAAVPGSDEFSHIYAEAKIDGQWIPMDAAREHVTFGQAPEMYSRRADWPITGLELDQIGQLHGVDGMGSATDWISAIGQQASQLISVLRANPSNLPSPFGVPGMQQVLTPSGTYAAATTQGGVFSTNMSGEVLILGGVLLLLLLKNR